MTVTVDPVHTGFAPIATCHWQSIANVLAARGLPDADRLLCPSWGCDWNGSRVLFGGGRWPRLVQTLLGVRIEQHSFPDLEACERFEVRLGLDGLPYVVEIDAYYLPSPYQGTAHVVHTVVVTDRTDEFAVIIDTTNRPVPATVPIFEYRRMRGAPCAGRLETFKLYLPAASTPHTPTGGQVFDAVRHDLATHAAGDRRSLRAFLDWLPAATGPINVCRPAAERYAAARLFDSLAEGGLGPAAELADTLRQLSDEWYLVHMLTTHASAGQPRQRRRVLRLLTELAEAEQMLHTRLIGS